MTIHVLCRQCQARDRRDTLEMKEVTSMNGSVEQICTDLQAFFLYINRPYLPSHHIIQNRIFGHPASRVRQM